MTSQEQITPKKPPCCNDGGSPNLSSSPRLGCCSSPSLKRAGTPRKIKLAHRRKVLGNETSPLKTLQICRSPLSRHESASNHADCLIPNSHLKENNMDLSCATKSFEKSGEELTSEATSSTGLDRTIQVNLEFPYGGWNEDSSDGQSSCNLEIIESEAESPIKKPRIQYSSVVCDEDSAILNGMGEEIERQLEAKAERNRLTVPNVRNILKSVITNPHVLAMVRRSMKNGNVAISGDLSEYEPRITRAKAKELLGSVPEMPWAGTSQKSIQSSSCQALMGDEPYDSEDDEEYRPCEDEPSDNDCSERDGSDRGSERDILIEQSPASFELDIESCPPTASLSPMPSISNCTAQTNWSEDGIFRVPQAPPDDLVNEIKEENIALRTRSKLPLNDTPLEEIEQAFVPPDITPDLYDTTCDNADWQEFLKEFMQPMRTEPHNNDDDEEDPEYNVLADEEIIDKEELRMDRAVKVSKRELNELMRELMEYTDNLSSDDDDDKYENQTKAMSMTYGGENLTSPTSSSAALNDDFAFLDAYMSLGSLTPAISSKTTTQFTPGCRSGLNTPVPSLSPGSKTPASGKKQIPQNTPSPGIDPLCSSVRENCVSQNIKDQSHSRSPSEKENQSLLPCSGSHLDPTCNEHIHSGSGKGSSLSLGKRLGNCLNMEQVQSSIEIKTEALEPSRGQGELHSISLTGLSTHDKGNYLLPPSTVEGQLTTMGGPLTSSRSCPFSHPKEEPSESLSSKAPLILLIQDSATDYVNERSISSELILPSSRINQSHISVSSSKFENIPEYEIHMTTPQKLLLEQQMRQHVQLLSQHFLQCYQHPLYNTHAATCKENLFTLKYLGAGKNSSAFTPVNLASALNIISKWEKYLFVHGDEIRSFYDHQIAETKFRKTSKRIYEPCFPTQLMKLMADSTAFLYPSLLPPFAFRDDKGKQTWSPGEIHLLALGLEQFIPFILETQPDRKRKAVYFAACYIEIYLLTPKNADVIYTYLRKQRMRKGSPIQHYFQHAQAPPTTHYVVPIEEQIMKPLRAQAPCKLPPKWRDYLYTAQTENGKYYGSDLKS